MRRLWDKMTVRQRWLAAIAAVFVVAVIVRRADVPWHRLPSPETIRAEEKRLRSLRKRLAQIETEAAGREREFDLLTAQARPYWQIQGRTPSVEVPAEFARLAQRAQVTPQQVGAPRTNKVLDLNDVREVEFSIRLTASMGEVSRLLTEMERSPSQFYWRKCNIRPDNRKAPQRVILNGRIRALVLSAEASRFLAGGAASDE